MQIKRQIIWLFVLACVPLGTALAHGERVRPLYVATDGVDVGDCSDPAAPCQTIGYALRWVGKGGQIRVAKGRYSIRNADDLFHLVGDVFDIQGGFDAGDRFRSASETGSVLLGVPEEFAAPLRTKGFHVLSDGKSADAELARKTSQLLRSHEALKQSVSFAPCVGGDAGGFDCDDVDLLAHIALGSAVSANPSSGADIWGFVDLNSGREYALVSYNIGTAVFDVTDATNPREVGFIHGQDTTWRDIKVVQFWNTASGRYDAYAYVTTDGSGDGLFVIDLTGLPQQISRVDYASDFSAAHNVFANNTDFGTGLSITGATPGLIVAGSNNGGGLYRSYRLDDPRSPQFQTMPSSAVTGYMHDAATVFITDSRKDSQCVNAAASDYCEVLFDFNVGTIDIWDITDPTDPELLSSPTYAEARYIHSGWWTEDKQYLIVHDELDEIQRPDVVNTTVRIYSIADLTNPVLAGTWDGGTEEVDHNGFTRGNRYYMSHYSRGLSILDITDPAAPTLTGFLDTYPGASLNTIGAWGAYPYFHSGHIAVSDINSGFYMLGDRTLDVPQGRLAFTQASFGSEEGKQLHVTVSRTGGSTGDISVAYYVLGASGSQSDITGGKGVLQWNDGDTADKTISLNLLNDGSASEPLEQLLIKLTAPSGGATLDAGATASIYVSEPGAVSTVAFARDTIRSAERGFATAVAVVHRGGSAVGHASVDYSMTAGDASAGNDFTGATSGTVHWGQGDAEPKWIEFAIADDGEAENTEFFELTLSNPGGAQLGMKDTLRIEIADGAGTNSAPNAVPGSNQTVNAGAEVTLDGSQSNDPDDDSLTYLWTQTGGTAVALTNADAPSASFTAPSSTSDSLLTFRLTVTDSSGLSDSATTQVTVLKTGGRKNGGSGGGSLFWLLPLLLIRAIRRGAGG